MERGTRKQGTKGNLFGLMKQHRNIEEDLNRNDTKIKKNVKVRKKEKWFKLKTVTMEFKL